MSELLLFAYLTAALAAVVMTYREQCQRDVSSPLQIMAGLTLSLAWPLTFLFFASLHMLRRG